MLFSTVYVLCGVLQLCGYEQKITLQVFVGSEAGRVKPHGFYQACKVSGKNSTACTERDIEGTTVIEIQLEPQNEMTAVSVDSTYMFITNCVNCLVCLLCCYISCDLY